jgi:hypothetical protein
VVLVVLVEHELLPAARLRRDPTAPAQAEDGSKKAGSKKRQNGTAEGSHRGASWNRTSDLHIISVTL